MASSALAFTLGPVELALIGAGVIVPLVLVIVVVGLAAQRAEANEKNTDG